MSPGELEDDRQSETRTLTGPGGITAIETLERPLRTAWWKSRAVVAYRDSHRRTNEAGMVGESASGEPDLAALRDDREGVADEVGEDPIERELVGGKRRPAALGLVDDELDTAGCSGRFKSLPSRAEESAR